MSNDYTDDTAAPNLPEDRSKFDRRQLYIEHTKGLWVRKNRAEDVLEIWHDGRLHCAWQGADKIDVRLTTMLREAYEMGQKDGKAKNQKALRDALGLGK